MPYRIEYSPEAKNHLKDLSGAHRRVILGNVQIQLSDQPTLETKKRVRLRPNQFAWNWELRIYPLRVFYDVEEEPEPVVYIYAVGVKEGNRLRIGGKIIDLGEEGPAR